MSMRIKFHKQDTKLTSVKIYSNGEKMVRVIIDTSEMTYKLVDPVSGLVHDSGGGVTNYEVLLRKAKKSLKALLNIEFKKEVRNVVPK